MTSDELYAKGYSVTLAAWGVSVYRTLDGSPGDSEAAVECVKQIHFDRPLQEAEVAAIGWEAAQVDLVIRRLTT